MPELENKLIIAIRVKSSIKDSKTQLLNAQTLKLTRLNQVLICPADSSVVGRLRALRAKVVYYYLDKEKNAKEIERLKYYLHKKFKMPLVNIDLYTIRYNFGVNSPYKQRVPVGNACLNNYLNTYLYRKKTKSKDI